MTTGIAITLRAAQAADVPALADLYTAAEGAIRVQLGAAPVAHIPALEAWLGNHIDSCVVAEVDGLASGFVEIAAPSELRAIYVAPAAWGRGVAAALHDHAVARLREGGATTASLTVIARNARARRFYERRGWTFSGDDRAREVGGVVLAFARYTRDL